MAGAIDKAKLIDFVRSRVKDWDLYRALSREAAMMAHGRRREAHDILVEIESGAFDAPPSGIREPRPSDPPFGPPDPPPLPPLCDDTRPTLGIREPVSGYWIGEDQ